MTLNPGRASSNKQRASLKMAVKRAIGFCGTAVAAAGITRVNEKRLSDYVAPQEDERHCPLDVALDLDLAAGQPVICGALAAMQGYRLVRIDALGEGAAPNMGDFRALLSEWRDVEAQFLDVIEDGSITVNEERALLKEMAELRAQLDRVEAKLVKR